MANIKTRNKNLILSNPNLKKCPSKCVLGQAAVPPITPRSFSKVGSFSLFSTLKKLS